MITDPTGRDPERPHAAETADTDPEAEPVEDLDADENDAAEHVVGGDVPTGAGGGTGKASF